MISAFIIGLAGSLHCVGMCGPLMISLKSNQSRQSFVIYHVGRLMVYSILGLAFGIIGQGLVLLEAQRVLAITSGLVLILLYAVPTSRKWVEKKYYESHFFIGVRKRMNAYFTTGGKWFVAGALNGLIPCGLIYLAVAGSLIVADPMQGAIFMLLFGLGTLPALALVGFFETLVLTGLKNRFSGVFSGIAIIAGCILVFRGLSDYPSINEFMIMSVNRMITICGM
ncbi:MAG: sulfite exporter TauE/SafE family protein [Cytophagales bacterium]|nr:sulfite exporter TauE/SafE family protein [Cytophagales bacterium]